MFERRSLLLVIGASIASACARRTRVTVSREPIPGWDCKLEPGRKEPLTPSYGIVRIRAADIARKTALDMAQEARAFGITLTSDEVDDRAEAIKNRLLRRYDEDEVIIEIKTKMTGYMETEDRYVCTEDEDE